MADVDEVVSLDQQDKETNFMMRMIRNVCMAFAVAVVLFAGDRAWASPSGLNLIPTTDVVPDKTFVLQTWSNLRDDQHHQQFVGFKTGLLDGLEFGSDWKAVDSTHGHATFQAKYAFDIKKDIWKGVAGVANVSGHRGHQGEVFPYVATSVDLKAFRLHLGHAFQPHNQAIFAGIDKTVPFLNRNLQLKADAIQIDNRDDILFSVGFLYDFMPINDNDEPDSVFETLTKNIVLECWVSMPTTTDAPEVTVKLNYVIKL